MTHIARKYIKEGKSYRIITPYDAQRNAIENSLKKAGLTWKDTCFNVDSFQGETYKTCSAYIVTANANSLHHLQETKPIILYSRSCVRIKLVSSRIHDGRMSCYRAARRV